VRVGVCGRWRWMCEVCGVVWCVVCISLSENWLGAADGAAMVQHLTSLTTLKYV
jgi:hypothetical protein